MEEHGMARTLKDLFAGAAGGIAQVLLGELCASWSGCFKANSLVWICFSISYHVISHRGRLNVIIAIMQVIYSLGGIVIVE